MFVLICIIGMLSFFNGENDYSNDISYEVKPTRIYAGYPFTIILKATKKKESYPFCFYPLQIEGKNEKVKMDFKGITTYEFSDKVIIELNIAGISDEPDSYTLGPFKLPYVMLTSEIERELSSQNTGIVPASYIDFPEIKIIIRDWKKIFFALVVFTLFSLFLISFIVVLLIRRWILKKKELEISEETNLYELLHTARGYRLDGNIYEFLKTLLAIVKKVEKENSSNEIQNLINRLQVIVNEVGYKGIKVSETDLDWYWKEVEKLVRYRQDKNNT